MSSPTSSLSVRPAHARLLAPLGAALALFPALAAAQQRDTAGTDSTGRAVTLPTVVTTATRAPALVGSVPRKIDVVTRADIERSGVTNVVDALKKLAAVDVIQYPGLLAGVGIRGFRPSTSTQQRTLVLLDGRPAGAYNLALLDLSNVERVEVLKGPASALYGSNAMGGAINIVTRRSTGAPSGSVAARYGTFQSGEVALQAGGRLTSRLDADLSGRVAGQGQDYRMGRRNLLRDLVGGDSARKLPANKPARDVADTRGDGVVRPYTTYHTRSGAGRLGASLGSGFRADLRGEAFGANDVPTPGDLAQLGTASPGDARKNVARRSADLAFSREAPAGAEGLTHAPLLRAYSARESSDNYDQPNAGRFVSYASQNTTSGGQLQDVLRAGGQTLTAGLDLTRVQARSHRYNRAAGATAVQEIGTYSPNSAVNSFAGFAEGRAQTRDGRVVATLGGRLDRVTLDLQNTPFRPDVTAGSRSFTVFNPSAGLQLSPDGRARVHGSVGRAFLAPDAFGLAGYAQTVTNGVAAVTVGNPGLAPEHSVTYDLGLGTTGPQRGLDVDVTYFHTAVSDRISSARASFPAAAGRPATATGTTVGSVTSSANAGYATIHGFETRLAYDLGAATGRGYSLRVFGNATRLFRAQERTRTVRVDVARFANARDFNATDIFGALVFSDTTVNARIKNVAALTADGGVEYDDQRRFVARLSGRYVGRRLDSDFSDPTDFSDVEYPPFLVTDALAGVRLTPRLRADVLVSNLTDENYYEKRGYNLAGRVVQLRLTAGF